MQNLQRLHDELDFADAATTQLDVALQFVRPDNFPFDAVLDRRDFMQDPFADGMGISETAGSFR